MHKDVYAKESGLAKYQFTQETIDVYSCGVYNGMLDLDRFTPLDEVAQGLSKSLHKVATNAFPHTTANAPKCLAKCFSQFKSKGNQALHYHAGFT